MFNLNVDTKPVKKEPVDKLFVDMLDDVKVLTLIVLVVMDDVFNLNVDNDPVKKVPVDKLFVDIFSDVKVLTLNILLPCRFNALFTSKGVTIKPLLEPSASA